MIALYVRITFAVKLATGIDLVSFFMRDINNANL